MYYRVRGPMSRYYRSALRYVGCSSGGAALPTAERQELAASLAPAAILAPHVYDLDELVSYFRHCDYCMILLTALSNTKISD